MSVDRPLHLSALALATALLVPGLASAAQITINNINAPGVGFNDPTVVAALPDNPGTTRGEQRLNVFQRAAEILGERLQSDVEIIVNAQFTAQTCSPTSAVLGSAGAAQIFRDFDNAPAAGTWYSAALADSLDGSNLSPGSQDINANFNANIDDVPTCLGGAGWYYGLDHEEGTKIDLLAVVMHELSHGLGFQTFVNNGTGSLNGGFPDAYMRNLFDMETGKAWTAMTNAERRNSAINDPDLVWTGPAVTARLGDVLSRPPALTINSPPAIAGINTDVAGATFGPLPSVTGVTGNVVLVNDGSGNPAQGCSALTNAAAVNGNIALVDRGTCNFTVKVANAQAAGAIGVVVANNEASGLPGMGGVDPSITIPSLGISQALGNSIKANLPGVNATIAQNAGAPFAGTNGGYMRLYAPNPLEQGSSVSHFTIEANPNLLMEPAINPDLTDDIDLTIDLFKDIGWRLFDPEEIFADGFE